MRTKLATLCIIASLSLPAMAQEGTLLFALPEKLPATINSSIEESLPLLSPNGNVLYFTRTAHPQNKGGKTSGQDIWQSTLGNMGWEAAVNMATLNNAANNALVGIARNGKRLYLLNHYLNKKQNTAGLSYSDYDEAQQTWGEQVPVTVPGLEVNGQYYSAWVSSDEKFIFWSLPGGVHNPSNDLYMSQSTDAGVNWSAPVRLGHIVNTKGHEISPYFDQQLGVLFFSSDGHQGFGGYDIFYTRPMDAQFTLWTTPENAGSSVNSDKFDAYPFSTTDSTFYFSSNRTDSLSSIFVSRITTTAEKEETESQEMALNDTSITTSHRMPAPELIIEKGGEAESKTIKLTTLSREELLDESTRIRFVYFPYKRYDITPKYIEVLDDVGEILDTYPDIFVRIHGHTDAVGSQAYNIVLSQNRALSAKEYLLIHGVDDDRVITKAFGKLDPYTTNLTDEGRALNRRVEISFGVMESPGK